MIIPHTKPSKRQCGHRVYLLTCDQYERLRIEASDRCQICRTSGPETKHGFLVIDHDAFVGQWAVRGLLCSSCNYRVPYGLVATDPRDTDYLANPWYMRMLAARGISSELADEPPVGTVLKAGMRRWVRNETMWHATDSFANPTATWEQLYKRFGPHKLTPVAT